MSRSFCSFRATDLVCGDTLSGSAGTHPGQRFALPWSKLRKPVGLDPTLTFSSKDIDPQQNRMDQTIPTQLRNLEG